MISLKEFQKLSLSFAETTEEPHFDKTSFKVKKKIFAVYNKETGIATLKLSEKEQDLFSLADKKNIYPVPNKWGKFGWTHIKLSEIDKELLHEALIAAYCEVAPPKLAQQFIENLDI